MNNPFKINLQLFADGNIDSLDALNSLLDGNTSNQGADNSNNTNVQRPDGGQAQTPPSDDNTDGGGQNLEPSKDSSTTDDNNKDGGSQQRKLNAAMARMRVENSQYQRTLQQIAQALGIKENDPVKLGDVLVNMAQEKLAKDANVPVELYKELHITKEQLAAIQYQQNQMAAKEKFMAVKQLYGLDDTALMAFAKQLDDEGINAVTNPNIDLEYEYYKRNREAIEQKKIAKAVEEALRNSQQADNKSTTPSTNKGAPQSTSEPKVNNVAALNDLLDGKK